VPATTVEVPRRMKAWVYDRYGSPDVLEQLEVPIPPFRDDHEVLIRVRAASVNPADRLALNPPLLFRGRRGLTRPKEGRPGLDLAGEVVVVGRDVPEFHVGDHVFGVGRGSFAEYAVADRSELALKPPGLPFDQAAALPIAGSTALQGLRDESTVRPGQRVLVNGASGGVGTFAVQIGKALGAQVSAVCSPANVDQARSLGADRVFDYSKEDFSRSGERFDVVFDTQLNHSLADYRRVMNPGGRLLIVGAGGGSASRLIARLIGTSLAAKVVGPKAQFFIASAKAERLHALQELVGSGKLTPVIDRSFPLSQVPDAFRYLAEGHARGKILITF
jgi:NADPH:quinone reductase-like Zn-dependent oxidoreductase